MSAASQCLSELAQHQQEWAATTRAERAVVAGEILKAIQAEQWCTAGGWAEQQAKLLRIDPSGPWGAAVLASIRFYVGSAVKDLLSTFQETVEGPRKGQLPTLKRRLDKDTVVFGPCPTSLLPGFSCEVWCKQAEGEDSTYRDNLRTNPDARSSPSKGRVTVVLGAGNQSFLALLDVLNCVLLDGECVLLKHHPLRPWLLTPFAILLAPLIARGVFRHVLDGGKEASTTLCCHPLVQRVHLTGSFATAQRIRTAMTASGREDAVLTSELGGAAPWVIAPGEYTDRELAHAARLLVTAKKDAGGCNCLNAQVLVLPQRWPQKDAFLSALRCELRRQPTYPSYYPGARTRRRRLFEHYASLGPSRAEACPAHRVQPQGPLPASAETAALEGDGEGGGEEDDHPCLLFCGTAGAADFDGAALQTEAFCPALAVVELPAAADGGSYLCEVAVPFVNSDAVLGSLACSLLVPRAFPHSETRSAVAALRYGSVAVNAWGSFGFFAAAAPGGTWGTHPSDTEGVSGNAVMGNVWGLRGAEKTVVFGPPLSSTPVIDLAKPTPGLLLDALRVGVVTAPTVLNGLWRVLLLVVVRVVQCVCALGGGGGLKGRRGKVCS